MYPDIRELSRFYQTPLGKMARDGIARRLHALWPQLRDLDVLALGFGSPWLHAWNNTRRSLNAMPAKQGVAQWPANGPVCSLLVDPLLLPFPANSFDRILLVHSLEESTDPATLLIQASRVLAANGKIVLVVPHRAGLWASSAGTPFGHGRSFSPFQLQHLLRKTGFQQTARTQALFAPPVSLLAGPRANKPWEQTGEMFWPFFGGVLLVEAIKTRMIDPRTRQYQPVFAQEPAP